MARGLPLLGSGMIVAVPVPEEHAAAGAEIEDATVQALREASEQGVAGADTTPFLLARVQELTGGRSLQANIQLVLNNAKIGAQLATEVAEQVRSSKV